MEETKAEPAQKTTPLAAQPDHHHKWNPFVAKRVAMKLASPAHAAPAAPAPAAAPGTPDRDECPICFEPEKSTALVPCGHILCGACAAKYAHCPVCREVVSSRMRVFW